MVAWAGSYLTKDAQAWWQQTAVRSNAQTWALFEAAVRSRFAPVEQAQSARVRLAALRQGSGADSLSVYIARFQAELEFAPDMAEADRLHRFVEGLRVSLMREVLRVRPAALTLAQMIERAIAAEAVEAMLARHGAPAHRRGGAGSATPAAGAHGGPVTLAAVDAEDGDADGAPASADTDDTRLGRMEATLAALTAVLESKGSRRGGRGGKGKSGAQGSGSKKEGTMSAEERRRHMEQGLCFRCHQAGHRAVGCPGSRQRVQGRAASRETSRPGLELGVYTQPLPGANRATRFPTGTAGPAAQRGTGQRRSTAGCTRSRGAAGRTRSSGGGVRTAAPCEGDAGRIDGRVHGG